jgi:hypothetical protein
MRCPKCKYENQDDATACLMCYAMLKTPTGEVKAQQEVKPKIKPEPKPVVPPPPPVEETVVPPAPTVEEIPSVPSGTVSEEPFIQATKEQPKTVAEQKTMNKGKGFLNIWWQVVSSPTEFFSRLDTAGDLSKSYVFALLNALILGAGLFLGLSLGWINKWKGPAIPTSSLPALMLFLLLWGIMFSATIFIQTAILNICAKLLLGKGKYNDTFKVLAYTWSVNVFGWIPGFNIIAGIYGLYITIIGLKKVHSFSTGKAILTILLPGILAIALVGIMLTLMMFNPGPSLIK